MDERDSEDQEAHKHPVHHLLRPIRWSMKVWKLNNLSRTLHYLRTFRDTVGPLSALDGRKVEHLLDLIQTRMFRIKVLSASRTFFLVLLYASVASAFAVSIFKLPWIEALTKPILGVSLLVGTPISFVYVILFGKLIDMYEDDVRLLASHVLAILSKYDDREMENFFKGVL